LDIASIFPLGLLLNTISHIIAVTSTDPVVLKNYLLLYVPENLFEGLAIFHIGSIVISEVFRYGIQPKKFERADVVSLLRRSTWATMLLSAIVFFGLSKFTAIGRLGSIGTIFDLFILGAVLYLSVYAHFYNEQTKINILFCFVIFLTLWAIRFAYLRFEIILPWVSYFLGEAIARKRLRNFALQSKLTMIALIFFLPPVFGYLGKKRADIAGRPDKISLVISGVQNKQQYENDQTIMARLSYINQLTNVVQLTRKKGFYEGKTLEYFTFAFIPRFLWPDKPTIQQGQWFAIESGLALRLKGGKANNSINMTVPGEFYLNFGWMGVILGCMLFALFVASIWNGIQGKNLPALALQFFILFNGMAGLGADLQIVVTLLAYFLIYKAYEGFVELWKRSTKVLGYSSRSK